MIQTTCHEPTLEPQKKINLVHWIIHDPRPLVEQASGQDEQI